MTRKYSKSSQHIVEQEMKLYKQGKAHIIHNGGLSMLHFRSNFLIILSGIFSLVLCAGSYAQNNVTTVITEKKIIITPPPKATSCSTIEAHWEGNIWIGAQTTCTYENRTEGTTWIESYWACTVYTNDKCTTWEYKPGHWVTTTP